MIKKNLLSINIYTWLLLFGGAIFLLEIGHILLDENHILITDIGHAGSHVGVALWGWILARKSFVRSESAKDLFRLLSSIIISIATLTGVLISIILPTSSIIHEHNGWILLILGILGIAQHFVLHRFHEHDHGHDILCSGLRWHVLADAIKSLMFAGIFFAGVFVHMEPYEPIFIWVARITLALGALSMLITAIIDFKKKQ